MATKRIRRVEELGWVALPSDIAEAVGIREGDYLEVSHDEYFVTMRKRPAINMPDEAPHVGEALIDLKALHKEICKLKTIAPYADEKHYAYEMGYNAAVADVLVKLHKAPPIDASPVVRCADCKHATPMHYEGRVVWSCRWSAYLRNEDHFCKLGERRTKK